MDQSLIWTLAKIIIDVCFAHFGRRDVSEAGFQKEN